MKRTFGARAEDLVIMARAPKRQKKSTIPRSLGLNTNNTGRVSAGKTDLAKAKGPFAMRKWVSFEYSNALTAYSPGSAAGTVSVGYNDAYDFDKGTTLGNKQPLYYDTLLTSTGPYKAFKVDSWEVVFTVVNVGSVPLNVWCHPGLSQASDFDTVTEADNMPGMKRLYLTGAGGSKSEGTITARGNIKDVWPGYSGDQAMTGSYNGGPSNIAYGGLVIQSADNSTVVTAYVAVKAILRTELYSIDALVS